MARTSEECAAALQATAGYDPYDPRQTRDVPLKMDVLGGLADGIAGLRIGVVTEGFDGAEEEVRDLVMAAVDVLASAGATVSMVSIPEHKTARSAQNALGEGPLSLFKTGFFGAFTRTYYPASIIAPINQMWAAHADVLAPRTKMALIASEMARKQYHGRLYAKGQNVRPTYIKAFDTALQDCDVLIMPTCVVTAPKNYKPATYLEALEDNLSWMSRGASQNTQPTNYTGHPALAMPVGKSSAGLPASMQIIGRFFDDPLLMRVAYTYQHSVDWDATIAVTPAQKAVDWDAVIASAP
jgi:amidase